MCAAALGNAAAHISDKEMNMEIVIAGIVVVVALMVVVAARRGG